jgi:hypothetical protein
MDYVETGPSKGSRAFRHHRGARLPVIDRLRGLVILMELESGLIHLPKETSI